MQPLIDFLKKYCLMFGILVGLGIGLAICQQGGMFCEDCPPPGGGGPPVTPLPTGRVFIDNNGNCQSDAPDTALTGVVTVELFSMAGGPAIATTKTEPNGDFWFESGVTVTNPPKYRVKITPPQGKLQKPAGLCNPDGIQHEETNLTLSAIPGPVLNFPYMP